VLRVENARSIVLERGPCNVLPSGAYELCPEVNFRLSNLVIPVPSYESKAEQYLQQLVQGKEVRVDASHVHLLPSGQSVTEEDTENTDVRLAMIRAGYGIAGYRASLDPIDEQAETEARVAKRGIWENDWGIGRLFFLWGTQLMLLGAALACLLVLVFVLASIVDNEVSTMSS
jgi:Staphylococcal nuclease homologue